MNDALPKEIKENRKPEHDVHSLILSRWSPRAMSGEEISDQELMTLFEAAKWAPSSFNGQPWRFIYAKRNTKHWQKFFEFLVEGNQGWVKDGAVLLVVISRRTFERNNKPARTHSFDAGSAWENLALQGTSMGLVVHAMQGFDYDRAKDELGVPDEYQVEAMVVIGKRGAKEDLPEGLREKELPSGRKSIVEITMEGKFKG